MSHPAGSVRDANPDRSEAVIDRPHLTLTSRFSDAVTYALSIHGGQTRKDSTVPYTSHLLGAAGFLVEQPGATEDMAIAALLHDTIEDHPTVASYNEIAERFGQDVARMVADCTDAETHPKPPWRTRKAAYLASLERKPLDSLMVSLADKLHNCRAMLSDKQLNRPGWERFNAPPPAQRWYYTSLAEVFHRRIGNEHSTVLMATVADVFADVSATLPLPSRPDRPGWVGLDSVTAWVEDLQEAAAHPRGHLTTIDPDTARTDDGRWWAERVDLGHPDRPILLFVRGTSG